jgi:hypothetical protein
MGLRLGLMRARDSRAKGTGTEMGGSGRVDRIKDMLAIDNGGFLSFVTGRGSVHSEFLWQIDALLVSSDTRESTVENGAVGVELR